MRKLDEQFMTDLKEGKLHEITALLRRDSTLDFHIRANQIHIYYRGGKIWDIKKSKQNQYKAYLDSKYGKECWKVELHGDPKLDIENKTIVLPSQLESELDVEKWVLAIPFLKQMMDEYFSQKAGAEREYQQHVVYENNAARTSGGTDYFVVDIEYANPSNKGRYDIVAILWPSTGHQRKLPAGYRPKLAFIEMKFGDGALSGESGIKKHLKDIDDFLSCPDNLTGIREEIQSIFFQKRELELLPSLAQNSNIVTEISDEKPQLILLLADHDPASKVLLNELELSPPQHCDLKIATANFMGYGLYQEAIFDLGDFQDRFLKQIYARND
jgi:hypothetical protein